MKIIAFTPTYPTFILHNLTSTCTYVTDGSASAVDICLYGLRIIMPLMTADLLKFPQLCTQYYRLVSFAAEVYPDRVAALHEDLLSNLLASVQLGMTAFGADICTLCCDFIYAMCQHLHSRLEQLQNSRFNSMIHPFLKVSISFIKIVLVGIA
jgi:hypothetical protein